MTVYENSNILIADHDRFRRLCLSYAFAKTHTMSTWKGKALEYLPGLKERILAAKDRQTLWREVERQFHAAVERNDSPGAAGCLKYAAWTLHPTPQAKTVSDVSESAARFLYTHADDLHLWIDRYDFMVAQKGLRFHLGDQKYSEFEARFLEKTARYPSRKKANQTVQRTGGSRSAQRVTRTSSAAASRR